jgi:lipoyl(octanoyl) transferase
MQRIRKNAFHATDQNQRKCVANDMKETNRLLPFTCRDGAHNMAADEVLLEAASRGVSGLRFYGWTEPTLSLGYFQSAAVRISDPSLAALPFVRRSTGGGTLVHHHELTYALALPELLRTGGEPWLLRMHKIIAAALHRLGVPCQLANAPGDKSSVLCFHTITPDDVLCGGAKVVGSAQRKRRHGFLQHGGILLAQSPFAPSLPGIQQLCGWRPGLEAVQHAVTEEFAAETGWAVTAAEWSDTEKAAIERLVQERYANTVWNEKR